MESFVVISWSVKTSVFYLPLFGLYVLRFVVYVYTVLRVILAVPFIFGNCLSSAAVP
jgi:hypothetical protein